MSETTDIQWTATPAVLTAEQLAILAPLFKVRYSGLVPGATHNPWIGCSKVSQACRSCYAETFVNRFPAMVGQKAGLPVWGTSAPRRITSPENWAKMRRLNKMAVKAGVRIKVFCASLADVFEDGRGLNVIGGHHIGAETLHEARGALWSLIRDTPELDWLLLTKRPENVARMVPAAWMSGAWPANVWLGTTVENEAMATARLPHLLACPAPVLFASNEPALEPVDWRRWLKGPCAECAYGAGCGGICNGYRVFGRGLDWIITGGESGHGARPYDVAWARQSVAQGRQAGVAVFVKQLGARPVDGAIDTVGGQVARGYRSPQAIDSLGDRPLLDGHGGDPSEWPADIRVRQWPR